MFPSMMDYLKHPFVIGLAVGLLITVFAWVMAWFKRRGLVQENRQLKYHLHTQMEITARGNDTTVKELDGLRRQNENLRITNATLNQKSGKAELRTLAVYDRALHLMYEQAPGFAPAWERVLKLAEDEAQQADKGFLPLLRKVFRPSLPPSKSGDKSPEPSSAGDTSHALTDVKTDLE